MMDFLKSIAPWLATAATGGVPALIGLAAKELTDALGTDVEPTQEGIARATASMTHEQILAVKQADYAFQTKMAELGYTHIEKLEALAVDNQKSARTAMVDGGLSQHLFWMSIIILLMTIGTNVWMLANGTPDGLSDVALGRAIGFLENISMIVLGFWYGTSHGSMMKNGFIGASK
jgi:hypothetical protein